jgi:hypothetical protein
MTHAGNDVDSVSRCDMVAVARPSDRRALAVEVEGIDTRARIAAEATA